MRKNKSNPPPKLDRTDRLLILKKPFDTVEVNQLVCSLTEKWNLTRSLTAHNLPERGASLENL